MLLRLALSDLCNDILSQALVKRESDAAMGRGDAIGYDDGQQRQVVVKAFCCLHARRLVLACALSG